MNVPFFIAKKIAFSKGESFSRFIIKIAIGAVALSMAVMIISTSLINGFQQTISDKVFGFWSHVVIMPYGLQEDLNTKPISTEIDIYQQEFLYEYEILWNLIKNSNIYATTENKSYFADSGYGELSKNLAMDELIRRSQVDPVSTLEKELSKRGVEFSPAVVYACAISLKYEGYINRSTIENERIFRLGKKLINWESIVKGNIANECRQRIEEVKPTTFSQLQRIDGIRPATLAFVAGNIIQ